MILKFIVEYVMLIFFTKNRLSSPFYYANFVRILISESISISLNKQRRGAFSVCLLLLLGAVRTIRRESSRINKPRSGQGSSPLDCDTARSSPIVSLAQFFTNNVERSKGTFTCDNRHRLYRE